MLEGRTTYTDLLNEIDLLKNDNFVLRTQNQLLAQELIMQRQRRAIGQIKEKLNLEKTHAMHYQNVDLQNKNKLELIEKVELLEKQRTSYLQKKFQEMSNSSFGKLKNLQVTMTKTRIQNNQLSEFALNIKKLYKLTLESTQTQNTDSASKTCKCQPTLKDLKKWIKSMASVKEKTSTKNASKKTKESYNGSPLSTKNN